MKLSDKGWRKVVLAENLLDDPDFEQSDFEDAVVLTIKEAKLVHSAIAFALMTTKSFSHQKELDVLIDMVDERIKQADMSKAST